MIVFRIRLLIRNDNYDLLDIFLLYKRNSSYLFK